MFDIYENLEAKFGEEVADKLCTSAAIMGWILFWTFAVGEAITAVLIPAFAVFCANGWVLLWYIPLLALVFFTIFLWVCLTDA